MRSTHCVEEVRSILGRKTKVGHGGTLDSTASGVLVLLIGGATRLSSFVIDMPKCYETTVLFGSETSTDDASGEVTRTGDASEVTEAAVTSALSFFLGWQMQSPPAVSAVHIGGERAHVLARSGADVRLEAKPVFFERVERISPLGTDGTVRFRIRCRKGTYIRSFARDLGRRLGCPAHVIKLERVSSGPFAVGSCRGAEELFSMGRDELTSQVLPLSMVYSVLTHYSLTDEGAALIVNGRSVPSRCLVRENFGSCLSSYGHVMATAPGIFSICSLAKDGGGFRAAPSVNIFEMDKQN